MVLRTVAVVRGATCDRSMDLFTPKLVQVNLMQIIVSVEASSNTTRLWPITHSTVYDSVHSSQSQTVVVVGYSPLHALSRAAGQCFLSVMYSWMGTYVLYGLSMTRHMSCVCLTGCVSAQSICGVRAHFQQVCLLVYARRTFSSPNSLT